MLAAWLKTEKFKLYFCLWLDFIVYALSLYRYRKDLTSRVDRYVMLIASRYGSIWYQEVWLVLEFLYYFTHLHCGITKFLAIGNSL